MNKEKIPGYNIVLNKIIEIKGGLTVTSEGMKGTGQYKFTVIDGHTRCEISLSHELLEDLNDFTGPKDSHYWAVLECQLEYVLRIPMQLSGIIPLSSNIFFKNTQDWEKDSLRGTDVYFSDDIYDIFQKGLKRLLNYLANKKSALKHLTIKFPYDDDISEIKNMIDFRENQIEKNGPTDFRGNISLSSRAYLKAATLAEFINLENEITHRNHPDSIKKAINNKIILIIKSLVESVFLKVKIPEYLSDYSNFGRESIGAQHTQSGNRDSRKYDVVLSFAGEDRGLAEKIARMLKADSFDVFYDKYEDASLWGKNLYEHLSEIYSQRGKYCVMFLSKSYDTKQWPTHERRAAQERAFNENKEYILPIRIDDTKIPGILDTIAYLDIREKSIDEIYNILKKKLKSPVQ